MAVILPNSVFIHIPKTGGTWITAALENAGLVVRHTGINPQTGHSTKHSSWRELMGYYPKVKNRPTWGFVRNPIYWWQSFWSCPFNRKFWNEKRTPVNTNWCGNVRWLNFEVQKQTQEQFDDFNVYAMSVIERRPGFFGDYFNFVIDSRNYKVGRHENLVDDVVRILKEYGEEFDEAKIRETPKENESDPELKPRRLYKRHVLEAMIESERKMLEQFGYSTNPDDYKHITAA